MRSSINLFIIFIALYICSYDKIQAAEIPQFDHIEISIEELLYTGNISNSSIGILGNKLTCIDRKTNNFSTRENKLITFLESKVDSVSNMFTIPFVINQSIFTTNSIICLSKQDSVSTKQEIVSITSKDNKVLVLENYPQLPIALSYASGVILNDKLYLLGESNVEGSNTPSMSFFMLDLTIKSIGWKELARFPGAVRREAILVSQSDGVNSCIYLIGGKQLHKNTEYTYFSDGYRYNPTFDKWETIKMNFPDQITSAVAVGANHILIFQNSSLNFKGKDNTVKIYRYHTVTNSLITNDQFKCSFIPNIVHYSDHKLSIYGVNNQSLYAMTGKIVPAKKNFGIFNTLVIVAYFLLLAGIGFYFSKRQKNTDDYFKGGGRIPWWAAGLSLFGTALSAITFMAIPSKTYATNWSYLLFNVGIIFVAPIIVYVFIPFFRKSNITTAYEYLEMRFNSQIRIICSLAFVLFQIGRMGVVLFLPSIALNVVTGLDILLCIGIMGICSILYTMIGGIEAVVWTDAIQVIILLGGALFAVIYIICSLPGGFSESINIAIENNKFSLGSIDFNLKDSTMWTVIIAACFTHLTTYGTDQSMVQRYLTTTSTHSAKKSVWTNAVLTIPATLIFFFIGTALFTYYKTYPEKLSISIPNVDAIFPWYIFTELPNGVVGLLISGIFAAAMSTLSGSMNSAATAYIVDIHTKFFKKNNKNNDLVTARVSTFIIGCISLTFALIMATWNISSLWDEFNKILGLILGSMGGLFMLGMLTKRANSTGAVIGIIFSIIVQFIVAQFQVFHLLLYTASGFITCFLVGYFSSLLFKVKN